MLPDTLSTVSLSHVLLQGTVNGVRPYGCFVAYESEAVPACEAGSGLLTKLTLEVATRFIVKCQAFLRVYLGYPSFVAAGHSDGLSAL